MYEKIYYKIKYQMRSVNDIQDSYHVLHHEMDIYDYIEFCRNNRTFPDKILCLRNLNTDYKKLQPIMGNYFGLVGFFFLDKLLNIFEKAQPNRSQITSSSFTVQGKPIVTKYSFYSFFSSQSEEFDFGKMTFNVFDPFTKEVFFESKQFKDLGELYEFEKEMNRGKVAIVKASKIIFKHKSNFNDVLALPFLVNGYLFSEDLVKRFDKTEARKIFDFKNTRTLYANEEYRLQP